MTNARFHTATSIIIVVTILALIAWDIATISIGGVDTTISRISLRFMTLHPMLALAAGALVGHLTWGTNQPMNRMHEVILMVVGLVLLVAMDLCHVVPAMQPLWPFLMGIPIGHALFGQNLSPVHRARMAMKRAKLHPRK